ncbi:hypothetical protein SASPL_133650 [Salvia splendens]|uniref:Transposase n=1 Tax=Salvia splendens TaxID=180675 RepID=A0A8X8X4L4_SALSN|nr:hypothetical protein SASPL_133650 [Salvia splendens]
MVHNAWGQSSAHEPWQYVLPTYMSKPPINESQQFYNMLEASKSDLWAGCEYSKLSTNARLMTMKSEHRLSQRAVDELCQFMEEHLSKPNRMPNGFYKCKKQMQALDMSVLKIHCCTKGCMIYWKEDENRTECKVCGHARFKGNGSSPFKKMYYFPLGPRLRRLYASEVIAQSMRWHAEHAQTSGEMRHPADSATWKTFDKTHPLFASESRNVRLALSTDGFQPFGQSGSQYSVWQVFDEGAETTNSELSKIFGWNKRSIFWDLPYWKTNAIRHNLDVMHIEKNIFDNIFNTIMNVEGKTKDNANARRDFAFSMDVKLNVKNKAAVEASICNAYSTEEASHFCTHYFESHVRCRGRDVPRNDDGGGSTHPKDMLQIFNMIRDVLGRDGHDSC